MTAADGRSAPTSGARRCDECGRPMRRAHKIHGERAICSTCYPRLFKPRPCSRCGKPMRALAQDPGPICRACEKAARVCMRCKRSAPEVGMLYHGKPVCPSCAPYFREARQCSRCGKPSTRLSRVVGLTEEPVCDACRRQLVCATCSVCGKHRERFALSAAGKPLCKRCASAPDASHPCPDCGTTVGGSGESPCLPCRMKRTLRRKADVLVGMYRQPEARRIFLDFVAWVIARDSAGKVAGRLPRYAEYLRRIDGVLQDGETIKPHHSTNILSTEDIRRAGLLAMFLSEQGLLADSRARAELSERRRIGDILLEAETKPWAGLLRRYADGLASPERDLQPRTQRVYLRAAVAFMAFSGVSRVRDLSVEHVRKFLRSRSGHRNSLRPWLAFLAANAGPPLSLSTKPRRNEPTVKSRAKAVARLLKASRSTRSLRARRAIAARLISVLYGFPLERVLELDRACIDTSSSRMRIRLEGEWIKVDTTVAALLREVVGQVGSIPGSSLFPGRLKGDHLAVPSIRHHVGYVDVDK